MGPQIVLTCEPVYTFIAFPDMHVNTRIELMAVVRDVTSARPDGYAYMPTYKSKRWDGYIHLCKGSYFPTGLLSYVVDAISKSVHSKGIPMDITYPKYPDANIEALKCDMFGDIVLRPYQYEAARTLIVQGRGVAKMATNAGKTAVIAAVSKMINGNVLVVVTSRDLLHQTADRLSSMLGEEVGKVGDGLNDVRRVTVGTFQTLHNKVTKGDSVPRWLLELDCTMYDECHHVSSNTSQDVLYAVTAPYRFGFSGTPLKHDDLADLLLMGATGPVVIDISNEQLVNSGISAKPIVEMMQLGTETVPDAWEYGWRSAYDDLIVKCSYRNHIIASYVMQKSMTTLILVDRIEHGRILSSISGSIFVNGSNTIEERAEALGKLRDEPGTVVIATPIFGEGIDVPAVELLVLAGGGKGHIKLLQQIGRGMRAKEGDNILRVLDFADLSNKYLAEHSFIRAELYEREGFEVILVE